MIRADKLFYTPDYDGKSGLCMLPEDESTHAIRVLRMQAGDKLHLVDGRGGLFEAEITNPHQKRCEVRILNAVFNYEKRPFRLHIAIAPTKMNERMEFFLEKATEIGIDEITPLLCQRSERKELKTARMEKILVAAMKQSVKAYLPKLNEICAFEKFIHRATAEQKFIAHCSEGEKLLLKNACKPTTEVLILIGPEGDFSEAEVALAREAGFVPVSLGNSRLRTETAGIVACHTVTLINE
ncbi:MAG: 16S rRNA (uracil(1498)-N(3))-methyltransferase [Prevotellaceae bacterium]|jgi:16S rRNA (uracil1498-N3)-methyltransferase|nr:16S rRNA (uracil(1498)-N(3))-methyltransferase [Prevotellaceae bacterium]